MVGHGILVTELYVINKVLRKLV